MLLSRVRGTVARQRVRAAVDAIGTMPLPAQVVVVLLLAAIVGLLLALAVYAALAVELLRGIRR